MKQEIKIYDVIGENFFGGGITAASVTALIDHVAESDEIVLRINSIGGSVTDAIAIYNSLRAKKCAGKTAVVDGVAMSAATIILLGCDNRLAYDSSILMIHNPWTIALGNADELEQQAEDLRVFEDAGKKIYLERMNVDAEKLDELLARETYLGAQEALDIGLVTEIDSQLSSPATANAAALKMAVMAMGKTQGKLQEFLAKKNAARPAAASAENDEPSTIRVEAIVEEQPTEPTPAPVSEPDDSPNQEQPPAEQPPAPEAPAAVDVKPTEDTARATAIQSIYAKHGKGGLLSDLTVRALAEGMSVEAYKTAVIDILAENQKPISAAVGGVNANLFRAAPKQQPDGVDHAEVYARLKAENKTEATAYFKQHKNQILNRAFQK